MDEILKRIEASLTSIQSEVKTLGQQFAQMDQTLTKQQLILTDQQRILDEHIRRTANLEARVMPLEVGEARWALAAKLAVPFIGMLATIFGVAKYLI